MGGYVALEYRDLAVAALLVVLDGALSLALRLGLERQLAVATLRMVVQLLLVGLVLEALFARVSPLLTGLAALAMVPPAASASIHRAGCDVAKSAAMKVIPHCA